MTITFADVTILFMLRHVLLDGRSHHFNQTNLFATLVAPLVLGCDRGGMTLLTKWCLLSSKYVSCFVVHQFLNRCVTCLPVSNERTDEHNSDEVLRLTHNLQ